MPITYGPGKASYPKYDTIPTRVEERETRKKSPMPLVISNNTRNQVIVAAILFLLGYLAGQ